MELKEFNILLDIKKHNKNEGFEVVQGDSASNMVNISLVNGLDDYNLTGTTIDIIFSKSDGTTVQQTDVTIMNPDKGQVQCILNTNTIASPGKVVSELRVIEQGMVLTSTTFEFYVRKSLIDDSTIESTNEFPVLTQLINTTESLIGQVEQIEAQVPEQVITDLNVVSALASQIESDLISHKSESAEQFKNLIPVNVLNKKVITLSKGLKIITNIPENAGTFISLNLVGYRYSYTTSDAYPVNIVLGGLMQPSGFRSEKASSINGFTPEIKLAVENNKLVIWLNITSFQVSFYINVSKGINYNPTWFENWDYVDGELSSAATREVIVPYV